MRKLNGITINGEYLGNSVVINGMFRAICTISPVIMRDFVLIINKIDRLEEAVKIHNFNCGFDCIDIEFENKTSKGMASLYFKLYDGEPLLKDCKLVIDDEEYSTFQERIKLRTKNTKDMTNPNQPTKETQSSELDRLQKIRELREKKQAMQKQQGGKLGAGMGKQPPNMPQRPQNSNAQNSLTPEQQKEQKRKELLEKKRKLLEAKKAKAGGDTSVETQETGANDNPVTVEQREQETATSKAEKTSGLASKSNEEKPEPITKTVGLVTQEDGTITNEQGQTVVKEERVNSDGTVTEVYVNPENPDEVYEQNENGEFVSEQVVQPENDDSVFNDAGDFTENGGLDENSSDANASYTGSLLENLSDEDLENMSDEELAALEAELNAELGDDTGYTDYNNYNADGYQNQGYNMPDFTSFADKLAQGLTEGLTQGLSQGLAQGLAQGFGGGGGFTAPNAGFGMNSGFDNNSGFNNAGFNNAGLDPFGSNPMDAGQTFGTPQPVQQIMPDYSQIDRLNYSASDSAKDSYSYDENASVDDISDFYSDFYSDVQVESSGEQGSKSYKNENGEEPENEIDALKAELEALKAQAAEQKPLMTVEEFMAKQQELKEQKEKLSRQKMRIVGSNVRVNASALDGGVFAAGKKLYKWGDTRVLDE